MNSFERKIIHDLAEKHKLFHKTENENLTISKTPFNDIDLVSDLMEKIDIVEERRYNLRSLKSKK
jgi:hypothetical protein